MYYDFALTNHTIKERADVTAMRCIRELDYTVVPPKQKR